MENFTLKKNSIYDDYYIHENVLGNGANGKVILCTKKQNDTRCAVKTLVDDEKARREIYLHLRACQGCPYIVQIVDLYENTIKNQKVILIVMECMEGGELFFKIKEHQKTTNNYFSEQEVAKMMHQICSAVKHLHSMNIAHRDLKPENLLLTSKDENGIIKLTDFGFAKNVNQGLTTPCYTPYYVPPEVLGHEVYDKSCDIWSLGVIMYILLCGYPPFYTSSGGPISPGMEKKIKHGRYTFPDAEWGPISPQAKDLITRMLETQPERRISIDDLMKSQWISQYSDVPKTPLPSMENISFEKVNQDIKMALKEMREDPDSTWERKDTKITFTDHNPLLEKRKNKDNKNDINNNIIVEDLSKEQSITEASSNTNITSSSSSTLNSS